VRWEGAEQIAVPPAERIRLQNRHHRHSDPKVRFCPLSHRSDLGTVIGIAAGWRQDKNSADIADYPWECTMSKDAANEPIEAVNDINLADEDLDEIAGGENGGYAQGEGESGKFLYGG
jgi:hypothetical protein